MPGKQNTYTLGEFGVNRVKSPVHLIDGELLHAQNADVPFEKGNRGLRKRSGMAKLNAFPLAGAIHSLTWIPLVDPLPTTVDPPPPADPPGVSAGDLYWRVTGGWLTSADGVTFTSTSTPSVFVTTSFNGAMVSHRDRVYFLNGSVLTSFNSAGAIETHGTLSGTITRPNLFCDWENDLIFGVANSGLGTFPQTAFRYNVASATYDELPGSFDSLVLAHAVGSLDGFPYVSDNTFGGVDRHNGTTWVQDNPVFFRATSFATFQGDIYCSTSTGVRKRGVAATWAQVYTPGLALSALCLGADGALYAADSSERVHRTEDGTTWAIDEDLSASISVIDQFLPWNDQLFAFNFQGGGNQVMVRDSGGVWSVPSLPATPIAGAVGYV